MAVAMVVVVVVVNVCCVWNWKKKRKGERDEEFKQNITGQHYTHCVSQFPMNEWMNQRNGMSCRVVSWHKQLQLLTTTTKKERKKEKKRNIFVSRKKEEEEVDGSCPSSSSSSSQLILTSRQRPTHRWSRHNTTQFAFSDGQVYNNN